MTSDQKTLASVSGNAMRDIEAGDTVRYLRGDKAERVVLVDRTGDYVTFLDPHACKCGACDPYSTCHITRVAPVMQ